MAAASPRLLGDAAAEIAAEAGALLRERFEQPRRIATKSASVDLVTDADHAADELIRERLRARFPGHRILTEESGATESETEENATITWVVDPLDGTVNFAHGVPHFAVSIAAVRNLPGEIAPEEAPPATEVIAGAICDPMRGEIFVATGDGPALLGGRAIRARSTLDLGEALVATGFPYDRRDNADMYLRFFHAALTRCRDVRRMGAAALDLAWVACGRLDGFFECGLHSWDIAAGALLARRAGAVASDFRGKALVLDARRVLVAPFAVHARLIEVFAHLPGATP